MRFRGAAHGIPDSGGGNPVVCRCPFPPRLDGYAGPKRHMRLEGAVTMAESHSPADDIVYNLVSIQYHALMAATAYARYAADAEGHDDVRDFVEQCRQEDARRA